MNQSDYQRIAAQYENEEFDTKDEFMFVQGTFPVIISTPHSVTHFRQNKMKIGEYMTAAIAIALHQQLNCSYITKRKNNFTDPNFDIIHPFKQAIIDYIETNKVEFLIDLHIMSSKRKPAIEIGTGKGKNIFNRTDIVHHLIESFTHYHIKPVIVDQLFTASNPNTVSSTIARETQIPCIQIEINWRLLDSASKKYQIDNIVLALQQAIRQSIASY